MCETLTQQLAEAQARAEAESKKREEERQAEQHEKQALKEAVSRAEAASLAAASNAAPIPPETKGGASGGELAASGEDSEASEEQRWIEIRKGFARKASRALIEGMQPLTLMNVPKPKAREDPSLPKQRKEAEVQSLQYGRLYTALSWWLTGDGNPFPLVQIAAHLQVTLPEACKVLEGVLSREAMLEWFPNYAQGNWEEIGGLIVVPMQLMTVLHSRLNDLLVSRAQEDAKSKERANQVLEKARGELATGEFFGQAQPQKRRSEVFWCDPEV